MPNPRPDIPHVLDDPPAFHEKLLDYGERPYWSADGTRIAFIETNYGDVCELDVETRKVRQITKGLGEHHSFLRVLFLSNGDYLLIGPRVFKDREVSRRIESELWVLDKNASRPPKPLGRRMSEGAGVSAIAPRITYSVHGLNDPDLGNPERYQCHVTDIAYGDNGPELGEDRVFYEVADGVRHPEPQDFRHDDTEVIMAEYVGDRIARNRADQAGEVVPEGTWKCVVKGVRLESGEVTTYIDEPDVHNECEGIFPDHEHTSLESGCEVPGGHPPRDLWKLKLDGSQRRARMTQMPPEWKATNSNISPDGRWLAFMVGLQHDEAGFGRGLGLLDLEAWEKSPQGQTWETPAERAARAKA